jgi:hypothetical protein
MFGVKAGFSFSLSAYLNVFRVWSEDDDPGQMQASITILVFSPYIKESLNTIVSFEDLNGTCCPWLACPF